MSELRDRRAEIVEQIAHVARITPVCTLANVHTRLGRAVDSSEPKRTRT
ncbi:MAG: hypothetical protein U5O16_24740 [Rhodococcus sp. (in: high G+C Gram-positive bacteria)]|nr:hypothetical protein [Rhodococcus sp. (in: high G+C Gram-positive bacteria)]